MGTLSDDNQLRLNAIEKAIKSNSSIDILNAISKDEVTRVFEIAKTKSFEQFFKNQNWLSKAFRNLGEKNPIAAEIVSWIMPFPKVAANILTMAYRYSPLNFVSALNQWSKLEQMSSKDYKGPITGIEQAQFVRTMSEASVGTFMVIAGAIAALLGWIDIDEDDYMGPSLVIGDLKIKLNDLAPSMTTFSAASSMIWAFKNDKSAWTQVLDTVYDNTLLGNIDNIFQSGINARFLENLSINYFSQYIPALLKLSNKWTTNQAMKDKSGDYFTKLAKTLASYVPGLSDLVADRVNPYTGDKLYRTNSGNRLFNIIASMSPITLRNISETALEAEANRLDANTTGLSGKFTVNGEEIELTGKDKQKYATVRADYINDKFKDIISNKEQITILRDSSYITTTYNKLTDDEKKKVMSSLYTKGTTYSKIKYWTDSGNRYVTSSWDEYNELRRSVKNIKYIANYKGSKFIK